MSKFQSEKYSVLKSVLFMLFQFNRLCVADLAKSKCLFGSHSLVLRLVMARFLFIPLECDTWIFGYYLLCYYNNKLYVKFHRFSQFHSIVLHSHTIIMRCLFIFESNINSINDLLLSVLIDSAVLSCTVICCCTRIRTCSNPP